MWASALFLMIVQMAHSSLARPSMMELLRIRLFQPAPQHRTQMPPWSNSILLVVLMNIRRRFTYTFSGLYDLDDFSSETESQIDLGIVGNYTLCLIMKFRRCRKP